MPRGVNRSDEARLQGRLWTPQTNIGAQLQLWLDGADLSTLTVDSSNVVTAWADKSGKGNNGAPASTYNSTGGPALRIVGGGNTTGATFVSRPGIFFNNVNDISGNVSVTGPTLIAYFMGTLSSASNIYARFLSLNVTASQEYGDVKYCNVSRISTNAAVRYERNNFSTTGGSTTYDRPMVAGAVFNGSSSWATVNGTKTGALTVSSNFAIANYRIGGPNYSEVAKCMLTGYVNEVIIGSGTYTERMGAIIEGYLAWKWLGSGNTLAASHPFKNRPPLIGD